MKRYSIILLVFFFSCGKPGADFQRRKKVVKDPVVLEQERAAANVTHKFVEEAPADLLEHKILDYKAEDSDSLRVVLVKVGVTEQSNVSVNRINSLITYIHNTTSKMYDLNLPSTSLEVRVQAYNFSGQTLLATGTTKDGEGGLNIVYNTKK